MKNELWNSVMSWDPTTIYIGIVAAVTAFRVMVYTVDLEMPSKVKISEAGWADPRIREVTYAWTSTIRTFMGFRLLMTLCILMMSAGPEKNIFCVSNILLDLWLWQGIYRKFVLGGKHHLVMVHRNWGPPVFLQTTVTLAGLWFIAQDIYLGKYELYALQAMLLSKR